MDFMNPLSILNMTENFQNNNIPEHDLRINTDNDNSKTKNEQLDDFKHQNSLNDTYHSPSKIIDVDSKIYISTDISNRLLRENDLLENFLDKKD